MIRISIPMAVIVTLFVGLRVMIRFQRRTGIGLDDWLIIVSLVSLNPTLLLHVLSNASMLALSSGFVPVSRDPQQQLPDMISHLV